MLADVLCAGPDQVGDQGVDHAPHRFVPQPRRREPRVLAQHGPQMAREDRHLGELRHVEQPGTHAVIHVVVVIGDFVREVGDLCLQRRAPPFHEALPHIAELTRVPDRAMLQDPLARLESKVQSVEGGVALFQHIHHAQALEVVLEPAVGPHACIERILAGVTERRMAKVVGERNGFGQVFIEPQAARDRSRYLRHLEAVREAGAEQIAFVVDEDLGLVLQAAEGSRMDDAVTIALVVAPASGRGLAVAASAGALRPRRVQGKVTPGHARRARRAHRRARRAAPLRR